MKTVYHESCTDGKLLNFFLLRISFYMFLVFYMNKHNSFILLCIYIVISPV